LEQEKEQEQKQKLVVALVATQRGASSSEETLELACSAMTPREDSATGYRSAVSPRADSAIAYRSAVSPRGDSASAYQVLSVKPLVELQRRMPGKIWERLVAACVEVEVFSSRLAIPEERALVVASQVAQAHLVIPEERALVVASQAA
jgi:hypothetical protein